MVAGTLILAVVARRNLALGFTGFNALPAAYQTALWGIPVFFAGGIGDLSIGVSLFAFVRNFTMPPKQRLRTIKADALCSVISRSEISFRLIHIGTNDYRCPVAGQSAVGVLPIRNVFIFSLRNATAKFRHRRLAGI